MKITAKQLTKELQILWPDLRDVWPMDREFWCPRYTELAEGLSKIAVIRAEIKNYLRDRGIEFDNKFINSLHDCDNFTLELQADISRYRLVVAQEKSIDSDDLLSWAFGTAVCIKVNGMDINHTVCIARTSDFGFVFVEPRTFELWIADKHNDKPYFVEMR
jgi:hypothetical protein